MATQIATGVSLQSRQQYQIAFVAGLFLLFGFISSADARAVTFLGVHLPPLCPFRLIFGLDCPGCGLTRACVFALHGHFYQSYFMHIWGIPAVVYLLAQIPYRLVRATTEWQGISFAGPYQKWVSHLVFFSFLLPWAVKLAFTLFILYLP